MFAAWLVLELLVAILLAAIFWSFTSWYRRHRVDRGRTNRPAGFVLTDEVNIDPTTGARQRVWYNPTTGERFYETVSDERRD